MSGTTPPNTPPTVTPPPKGDNVKRETRENTVNGINSVLQHYRNLELAQDVYENVVRLLDYVDVAFGIFTMGIASKIYSLFKLCYDNTTETIRKSAEEKVITGMMRLLAYGAPAGSNQETVKEANLFRIQVLQLIFNGDPARILELRGRVIKTKHPEGGLIDRIVRNDAFIELARLVEAGATLNTSTASTDAGANLISIESYIDSIASGWLDKTLDLGDDSSWTRREYLRALAKSLERGQLPPLASNLFPDPFFPLQATAASRRPAAAQAAAAPQDRERARGRRNVEVQHLSHDADEPTVLQTQESTALTFAYDRQPIQRAAAENRRLPAVDQVHTTDRRARAEHHF